MLLSGLLALMRGFTREVLSLVAWGAAAAAAIFAVLSPEAKALAGEYIQQEVVATIALGGGVFLIVLVLMSVIGVRIADRVLETSAGPFDRTLGLFYGLARGLALVVVAYLFYIWLIPRERMDDAVRNARLLPVVESVSGFVISFLPPEIAQTLRGNAASAGRSGSADGTAAGDEDVGYRSNQTRTLDQIIESTQGGQRPSFGSESGNPQ